MGLLRKCMGRYSPLLETPSVYVLNMMLIIANELTPGGMPLISKTNFPGIPAAILRDEAPDTVTG